MLWIRMRGSRITARDIAVMAATLANRGINPVTGEQVLTPYAISRTLSVMTSSGMYDYAGEWIYRIGIPAKSGVGGGIGRRSGGGGRVGEVAIEEFVPEVGARLAGALERQEPWGVWGGQLLVQGAVVARKRPRGRPRKHPVAA